MQLATSAEANVPLVLVVLRPTITPLSPLARPPSVALLRLAEVSVAAVVPSYTLLHAVIPDTVSAAGVMFAVT